MADHREVGQLRHCPAFQPQNVWDLMGVTEGLARLLSWPWETVTKNVISRTTEM